MRGVKHVLGLAPGGMMLMDGAASLTMFRSVVAVFVFGDALMVILFGCCRGRIRR